MYGNMNHGKSLENIIRSVVVLVLVSSRDLSWAHVITFMLFVARNGLKCYLGEIWSYRWIWMAFLRSDLRIRHLLVI